MLFGALLLPWQVITAEEVPTGPAVGGAGHPEDSPARPSEALVGGQAVIEGVMMRAPHSYCVAVRKPKGEIQAQTAKIVRPSERNRIWGWPILRGLGTLGQAMVLGLRALRFSADVALEEDGKPAEKEAAGGPPKRISNWWMGCSGFFSSWDLWLPFRWRGRYVAFSPITGPSTKWYSTMSRGSRWRSKVRGASLVFTRAAAPVFC